MDSAGAPPATTPRRRSLGSPRAAERRGSRAAPPVKERQGYDDLNGDQKGSTEGMALLLNKLAISRTPKNVKWDWRLRRANDRILAA